jgi:hypothetical protein
LSLAVLAWAAGCAGPRAIVDPAFQKRTYTPARIALLPIDVFAIYDHLGDNDPEASAAIGRLASMEAAHMVSQALRRRGYDVDFSASREGVAGSDGKVLVSAQELDSFINSIARFASSDAGDSRQLVDSTERIAPELAARVGWATQSDTILYANIKGVVQSSGKRSAQVVGGFFFVAVVLAVVLLFVLEGRGGAGASVGGAAPPRTVRAASLNAIQPTPAQVASVPKVGIAPSGYGRVLPGVHGGRAWGGLHTRVGVGVVVPLERPAHTHEGAVIDEDPSFGGDHIYASLTLVSAHDGRVIWHLRDDFDVELDSPDDLERFVDRTLGTLPASLRPKTLAPPKAEARPAR